MYYTNAAHRVSPPSQHVSSAAENAPTIFLAGPIQGTYDWQHQAIKLLNELAVVDQSLLYVANPRATIDESFVYAKQVAWETRHLRIAAAHGCIMFWLNAEIDPVPGRAYAQTSRFELGEWLARRPEKVVIGAEVGFSGTRYIQQRLDQDMLPNNVIYDTLGDTCRAAYRLARR